MNDVFCVDSNNVHNFISSSDLLTARKRTIEIIVSAVTIVANAHATPSLPLPTETYVETVKLIVLLL